jgi:hypothetical protein
MSGEETLLGLSFTLGIIAHFLETGSKPIIVEYVTFLRHKFT